MTGDGKSSRGTGQKSRSGKTYETSHLFNPYRTMLEKGEYVEGFKEDEVHDALTKNRAPKGPPLLLISSVPESPARMLASLDGEPDSPENGQDSSSSSPESCESYSPSGSSSRTFQACFLPIKDLISLSSSIRWTNAGMAYRGAFSTASSSESPSVAAECSLSDILVPHAHPKYSLSPKAAAGILRRAERRGRALPTHLEAALVALMNTPAQPTSPVPCAEGESSLTATETRGMSSPLSPESVGMTEGATNGNPESGQTGSPGRSKPSTAAMSVRRLTPTECERLQGMPDGWTHVHGAPMVGATPLWETLLRFRLRNGLGDES